MANELIEIGGNERALLMGDLSKLNEGQRGDLYSKLCNSLGLNPLTSPFQYIQLNGRWVFYASKGCTDQLRAVKNISIYKVEQLLDGDTLTVMAYARDAGGREDQDVGVVDLTGLKGVNRANAVMRGITKAKRRVTLSICGLGMLDETEVQDIPNARPVPQPFTDEQVKRAMDGQGSTSVTKLAQIVARDNEAVLTEPREFTEAKERRVQAEKEAEAILASAESRHNYAPGAMNEPSFDPSPLPDITDQEIKEALFNPADYKMEFGKDIGKTLSQMGVQAVRERLDWVQTKAKPPLVRKMKNFVDYAKMFLASQQ